MRTFSATLDAHMQRTDGAGFRAVLEFAPFTPPYTSTELAGYFASTSVFQIPGPSDPPGFTYTTDATVLSVLGLDETQDRLGDVKVTMVDHPAVRENTHLGRKVSVRLWPVGVAYTRQDIDIIFVGTISDPIDRAHGKISFDLISAGYQHNRSVRHLITLTDFPEIDPALVGGNLPVIYGTVPKVPGILRNADIPGVLMDDMSGSDTTIAVIFNRDVPSTGHIRIDSEVITYQARYGPLLQNCARGVTAPFGSVPTSHGKGSVVTYLETPYYFNVAAHNVKSITNVRYGDKALTLGSDYDTSHSASWSGLSRIGVWASLFESDWLPAKTCVADVSGWADDAQGSITGTPYTLIERPDHIVRHLLRTYGGASSEETDSADFDDFGEEKLGIYLPSEFQVFDVLAEIARQCQAAITYSGRRWIMRKHRINNIAAGTGFGVSEYYCLRSEDGTSTLTHSSRSLSETSNRILYRYGARPDGSWVETTEVNDPISQSIYGVRSSVFDFSYFYSPGNAAQIKMDLESRRTEGFGDVVTAAVPILGMRAEIGDKARVYHSLLGVYLKGFVVAIRKDLTGDRFGTVQVSIKGCTVESF